MTTPTPAQTPPSHRAGRLRFRRLAELAVLLAVCAGVRIWLIAHTEVISNDGVRYVRLARRWRRDAVSAVRGSMLHPGYAVALSAVQRAMGREDLASWDLAGQIVSLASAAGATAAIWLFAGMVFNWRIAWISGLLFAVGRKWAIVGADVVTDPLAVCLQMWAVVLTVLALRRLRAGSTRALPLAAGVGLAAGLGYLVRLEALLPAGLAAAAWIGFQVRRRRHVRLALAAAAVTAAVTVAVALPYALTIGALTHKRQISDFTLAPAGPAPAAVAHAAAAPGAYLAAADRLIGQLFEALHPAVGFLVLAWAATWVGLKLLRLPLPKRVRVLPTPEGAFLMAATLAALTPALIQFHVNIQVMSYRYLLLPAAVLAPLAGAGVVILAEWIGILAARLVRLDLRGRAAGVIVAAVAIPMLVHTLRPLHQGKGNQRLAAEFAAARAAPGEMVLVDNPRVRHYAEIASRGAAVEEMWDVKDHREVLRNLRERLAGYVVLGDRKVARSYPRLADHLREPAFGLLKSFPDDRSTRPDTYRVYLVDQAALRRAPAERRP